MGVGNHYHHHHHSNPKEIDSGADQKEKEGLERSVLHNVILFIIPLLQFCNGERGAKFLTGRFNYFILFAVA